jgi:hypothetical protein
MRIAYLISTLCFLCLFDVAQAQNKIIQGNLTDTSTKQPIVNASVMVLRLPDSVLVNFTRSATDGSFSMQIPDSVKPVLLITHPLFAEYIESKPSEKKLNRIALTSKSKMLETIIIRTGGSIKIKGDTTIYTADSFNVSANANVEELLKKLPGIQVDRNGDIKAMGEKVEKVLVDGEEFFGDDPGMAVKNLRADAVKEVQVFDKKSEQAVFTGIDDGNTKKTINLKLKEDKKRGYFGKVSLSGGIGENIGNRFNNNLLFGSFKGKRKISAFVLNGNTGQDGLGWQERMKYGGDENNFEMMDEDGIFSYEFRIPGSEDEIFINTENGFIRNTNAGLQYSNKWNDRHKINFTPRYNQQDYENQRTMVTETQFGDSSFRETALSDIRLNRYNTQNKLVYDATLDSFNSIKITAQADIYHSEYLEQSTSLTQGNTGTLKNGSDRLSDRTSDKSIVFGNLLFKHKFRKSRRTLSLDANWKKTNQESDQLLTSTNKIFINDTSFAIGIDQQTTGSQNSDRISGKLIYTEPLTAKWAMEFDYQWSIEQGRNNQRTLGKDGTGNYSTTIDSLTNDFDQSIIVHTPSTRFNYNYKKIKIGFGSGFGITQFDFADLSQQRNYRRDFINLFPSASFVYSYKGNHSLRVKYNGSNTQPTLNQLQPLRNNNNIFSQYIGNPDLKPSFTNNINLTNNGYNFLKNQWNYQTININFTQNSITNNRTIDPKTGSTIIRPVNTNGNISISSWNGIGFKNKKTDVSVQINGNANYSRFADFINSNLSFSNTINGGVSINLSKSKKDVYDVSLNNDFNYNYNTNAQTKTANTFRTNNLTANATVYYQKTWSIITDYSFMSRQKLAFQSEGLNVHLLNVQLQKTFKNNEFTVYIKARDLLNQNIGLERNFFANTFTEERNQRLRRYFMIGFNWDFKNGKK